MLLKVETLKMLLQKLKENRNVVEDETKISADLEDHSSKAASRREALKKKFNDMIDEDLDFEFNRYSFIAYFRVSYGFILFKTRLIFSGSFFPPRMKIQFQKRRNYLPTQSPALCQKL